MKLGTMQQQTAIDAITVADHALKDLELLMQQHGDALEIIHSLLPALDRAKLSDPTGVRAVEAALPGARADIADMQEAVAQRRARLSACKQSIGQLS